MDDIVNYEKIKKKLSIIMQYYINTIKSEYKNYISPEKLNYLNSKKDFCNCIEILDNNTVTCFYNCADNKIIFPKEVEKVILEIKQNKLYGTNPNHKLYNENNLIQNENNFFDYVNHIILIGGNI